MNIEQAQEPLMVLNPHSDKLIDVTPLLDLTVLAPYSAMADDIDKAIKLTVCTMTEDSNPELISNACHTLYVMRDMLNAIAESQRLA